MAQQALQQASTLALYEAAQLIAGDPAGLHDAELALAHAIEQGELAANVKRWATEQWEGKRLPGNINRRETFIRRADLEAWQQRAAARR